MSDSKSLLCAAVALTSLVAPASGAAYFTDFTGYSTASDLSGQNGWQSNDSTPFVTGLQNLGGEWGNRSGYIGFATPALNNVYVYQSTATALVGSTNASFSSLFRVIDSDSNGGLDSANRDTFGFRLENAAGDNLFSFFLLPFDHPVSPEDDDGFHTYAWSTGNNTPTLVLPGFASAEAGGPSYQFSVNFSQGTGDDVNFSANVGANNFTGVLPGLDTESIAKFGAFWQSKTDAASNGSNYMNFDNVTLVPEPSSSLLGLLCASLAFVRRRRA